MSLEADTCGRRVAASFAFQKQFTSFMSIALAVQNLCKLPISTALDYYEMPLFPRPKHLPSAAVCCRRVALDLNKFEQQHGVSVSTSSKGLAGEDDRTAKTVLRSPHLPAVPGGRSAHLPQCSSPVHQSCSTLRSVFSTLSSPLVTSFSSLGSLLSSLLSAFSLRRPRCAARSSRTLVCLHCLARLRVMAPTWQMLAERALSPVTAL